MPKGDKSKHFEEYPDWGPQDDGEGGEVSADEEE